VTGQRPKETDPERLTRNWNELLQELRVTQTGVQILTGFLLTLPFTQRFADLDRVQRDTYLILMVASVVTTGLIIAPVAFHRALFRQHQRRWLVEAANLAARTGLILLALNSAGVIFLVFDVVVGRGPAVVASLAVLVFLFGLWGTVPFWARPDDD
jgi:hypothetical protein